jgi:hypothetical protein
MLAGFAGTPDVMVMHFGAVITPQMLVAFTHKLPLVKPALRFRFMVLEVEVPVVLFGNVHI